MKKIIKVLILLFIILGIMVIIGILAVNENIVIREYSEKTSKITENTKLLLITDLHSVKYGDDQSVLIEKIDEINPDFILFGGDIFDDKRSDEGSELLFENIGERYNCYYVSGNHEYWSYKVNKIKDKIRSYGVTVLEGDSVMLNSEICLWGVDDPDCQREEFGAFADWYSQLWGCNTSANESVYNILLTHRPERVEDYKACKFDLTLCGHAHGGQWRIPFIINGLYAPNQGFFPKYAGGKIDIGNGKMIVSRGLALSNIPRIFNPPELVVVNIEKNK